MEIQTVTHENGRKYEAYMEGPMQIIIGPPEGLVDALGLPEPFATNLHNILHQRKLLTYAAVQKNSRELQGALQEALMIDVQKLAEEYFKHQNQEV